MSSREDRYRRYNKAVLPPLIFETISRAYHLKKGGKPDKKAVMLTRLMYSLAEVVRDVDKIERPEDILIAWKRLSNS